MIAALSAMSWTKPSLHPVGGKPLMLKTAPATSAFWEAYRGLRDEWFRVGISVGKRGKQWYVKCWSDEDGEFTVQEPKP